MTRLFVHPYDAHDDARLKSFIALSGTSDCYSYCNLVLDLLLKNRFCKEDESSVCSIGAWVRMLWDERLMKTNVRSDFDCCSNIMVLIVLGLPLAAEKRLIL